MNTKELVIKYQNKYDKIIISLSIGKTSIFFYKFVDNELKSHYIKPKENREYLNNLREKYQQYLPEIEKRFNKIEIDILPNGEYKENYIWDKQKEYNDKLIAAKYFGDWVNELMINRIFDYEEDNKLLEYDKEFDCYKQSWDYGIFTFKIIKNKLTYKIELSKNGVFRLLDLPLHKAYIEPFIEHYNITKNELKNDWEPWNKLIIKSSHTDILNRKENIIYSFEIENQ